MKKFNLEKKDNHEQKRTMERKIEG